MIKLHPDFSEFLRLLNSNGVRYLVIGGYAVGYHGYARATGDLDIWINIDKENAENTARAVREFGMPEGQAQEELFLQSGKIIRMGFPPVRIELLTSISGVSFEECYAQRETPEINGILIDIISLPMLKANKRVSGRLKDLDDLRHLP
jgi:hypothetical protein